MTYLPLDLSLAQPRPLCEHAVGNRLKPTLPDA